VWQHDSGRRLGPTARRIHSGSRAPVSTVAKKVKRPRIQWSGVSPIFRRRSGQCWQRAPGVLSGGCRGNKTSVRDRRIGEGWPLGSHLSLPGHQRKETDSAEGWTPHNHHPRKLPSIPSEPPRRRRARQGKPRHVSIRLAAEPTRIAFSFRRACLRRLAIFTMVARVAAAPRWNGTCMKCWCDTRGSTSGCS
jgi:hypothetical protein